MYVITDKKLQLDIARLCRHNFLSLVLFQLGGARASPGYAYGSGPPGWQLGASGPPGW